MLPGVEQVDKKALGERIRAAYQLRGFTRRAFANAVGVAYNTMWRYEKGQNAPPSDVLVKIARLTGQTSEDLLTYASPDVAELVRSNRASLRTAAGPKRRGRRADIEALAREIDFAMNLDSVTTVESVFRLADLALEEPEPHSALAVKALAKELHEARKRGDHTAVGRCLSEIEIEGRRLVDAALATRGSARAKPRTGSTTGRESA